METQSMTPEDRMQEMVEEFGSDNGLVRVLRPAGLASAILRHLRAALAEARLEMLDLGREAVASAKAAQREADAKIADSMCGWENSHPSYCGRNIAAAIRQGEV